MRKKNIVLGALVIALCLGAVPASAAPSIDDLHTDFPQTVTVQPDDGSAAAQALSRTEIYCAQALPEQYMEKDAQGNPVDTALSKMIAASCSVTGETGGNGRSIPDEIPTVRQLVEMLGQTDQAEYGLDRLEQLTYMMDLKYVLTGQRVVAGGTIPGQAIRMRDGRIRLTMDGGEVLRAGKIEDFVILLASQEEQDYCFLTMKEYDADTGIYTVEFPYIGSFMVMQIMEQ